MGAEEGDQCALLSHPCAAWRLVLFGLVSTQGPSGPRLGVVFWAWSTARETIVVVLGGRAGIGRFVVAGGRSVDGRGEYYTYLEDKVH